MKRLKESTRQKLMESAIDEFSTHGFEGANVDNISLHAGFGKGTIYNYFESKMGIFLAVIQESINELVEAIRESIKDINDPEEKLAQAVRTDVAYIVKNSSLIMTIFREAFVPEKERRDNFFAATLTIFELYRELVEEGIEAGVFSSGTNSFTAANAIMSVCENLALSNVVFEGALGKEDELADWIVGFIFHGLKDNKSS